MRTLFLVTLAMALLGSAAALPNARMALQIRIDAANTRFGAYVKRHDASAIAADYVADGVLIPAKGAPIRGRAAITRYYAARFSVFDRFSVIRCATDTLALARGAALEEGSCQLTPRDKNKDSVTVRFTTVWKIDADGQWRIAVNE